MIRNYIVALMTVFWSWSASANDISITVSNKDDSPISALRFSPDGERLTSVSDYGVIRLWEVESGRLIRSFGKRTETVSTSAISSDGETVATTSIASNNNISLYDTRSGKSLEPNLVIKGDAHEFILSDGVIALAFSLDGTRLAFVMNSVAGVYDIALKEIVWTTSESDMPFVKTVSGLVFSPDGETVFLYGQELTVMNARTGQSVKNLKAPSFLVLAGLFSRDGRYFIGVDQNRYAVWDVESGERLILNDLDFELSAISLLPDANGLFLAADTGVATDFLKPFTLDNRASQELGTNVEAFDASSDGRRAFGELDGGVFISDVTGENYKQVGNISGEKYVSGFDRMKMSKDGTAVLIGGSYGPVRKWDLTTGELLKPACSGTDALPGFGASDDLSLVAFVSGDEDYVQYCSDEATDSMISLEDTAPTPGRRLVEVSPSGTIIAAASATDKPSLKIWRRKDKRLIFETDDPKYAYAVSVTFSPDEKTLLISTLTLVDSSRNAFFITVDVESGAAMVIQGGSITDSVQAARYGPNQYVALTNETALFFDNRTSELQNRVDLLKNDFQDVISIDRSLEAMAVSPDLGTTVYGGGPDLYFFDSQMGVANIAVTPSSDAITAASFSPDGKRVLALTNTGTIFVLDSFSGATIATMYSSTEAWLTITSQGFFTGNRAGAELVNVATGVEVVGASQLFQTLYRPDLVRQVLTGANTVKLDGEQSAIDLATAMGSGQPPTIALKNLTDDQTQATVSLEATLSDNGGGFGRVEWRIDGITLGVDEPENTGQTSITVKRDITVTSGTTKIEVIAYNSRNLISSSVQFIEVTSLDTLNDKARLFVLAVGVDDYDDPDLKLNFPVRDVTSFADALKSSQSGLYASVEIIPVLNKDVTRENINAAFNTLQSKIRPIDVFVFFIAGHGKTVDGRFYFIPPAFKLGDGELDMAQAIDQDQLQTWFSRIVARKALFMSDTCESGSLLVDRSDVSGAARIAAIDRLSQATGRAIFAAAASDAPALEGIDGHGVFTYSMLNALDGGDTNGNGTLEISELVTFTTTQIPKLSLDFFKIRQDPQISLAGLDYSLTPVVKNLVKEPELLVAEARSIERRITVKTAKITKDAKGKLTTKLDPLPRGTRLKLLKKGKSRTLVEVAGKEVGWIPNATISSSN